MSDYDPTEAIRRVLTAAINSDPEPPAGPTWTTDELRRDFEVIGYGAPFVVVRRKADGVVGSLSFRHHPRVYFDFVPDTR